MELTADDLKPLLARLSHEERVRLARLALAQNHPRGSEDRDAYLRHPVGAEEFSTDASDPLAWDAEGWDEIR